MTSIRLSIDGKAFAISTTHEIELLNDFISALLHGEIMFDTVVKEYPSDDLSSELEASIYNYTWESLKPAPIVIERDDGLAQKPQIIIDAEERRNSQ